MMQVDRSEKITHIIFRQTITDVATPRYHRPIYGYLGRGTSKRDHLRRLSDIAYYHASMRPNVHTQFRDSGAVYLERLSWYSARNCLVRGARVELKGIDLPIREWDTESSD